MKVTFLITGVIMTEPVMGFCFDHCKLVLVNFQTFQAESFSPYYHDPICTQPGRANPDSDLDEMQHTWFNTFEFVNIGRLS